MNFNYQIMDTLPGDKNAGSKAKDDIANIANDLQFKRLNLIRLRNGHENILDKIIRQIFYLIQWSILYLKVKNNATILIQTPFLYKEVSRKQILNKLKKNKKIKVICLIHDVEELRQIYFDDFHKEQFEMILKISDQIIVHNDIMKNFFIKKGYPRDQIINLEIFDYLISDFHYHKPHFEKSVFIAGNLDPNKAGYLKYLDKINSNFILYGSGYHLKKNQNIDYRGAVSPDKLPVLLDKGFGLVWDGNSIKTCDGPFGNYLRYNDPHKLSLYLASGIPVFIWSKAAEASFVKKYKVGYTIDSLNDISTILDKIDSIEYDELSQNVKKVSSLLTHGYFFDKSLKLALKKANNVNEENI